MKKYLFIVLVIISIGALGVKLSPNVVTWQDAGDPSIVKHRVYYELSGTEVTYLSPFVEIDVPVLQYDLSQVPGSYNGVDIALKLSAVDGAANESDLSQEKVLFLDNQPPATPLWN